MFSANDTIGQGYQGFHDVRFPDFSSLHAGPDDLPLPVRNGIDRFIVVSPCNQQRMVLAYGVKVQRRLIDAIDPDAKRYNK
jgi:hypothetical protein